MFICTESCAMHLLLGFNKATIIALKEKDKVGTISWNVCYVCEIVKTGIKFVDKTICTWR